MDRTRPLSDRLRLMVVTDPRPSCGRRLLDVVAECMAAGATALQLRDKSACDMDVLALARAIRPLARRHEVLFLLNDRFDLAVAAEADGVHLGPEDLSVRSVREATGGDFVIGYSTDSPDGARRAAADGASYVGVGAVFGSRSKPGLENEVIGPGRIREIQVAAGLPCVGIGGIDLGNVARVAETGAGVAVLSAVLHASDPGQAVRELLQAMG